MHSFTVASLFLQSNLALASTLWATHYDGTVSKLSLDDSGLTLASQEKTCGIQPSWLTYDASSQTLYCVDEYNFGTGLVGSLSAYDISSGTLSQTQKVSIPGNGVHSSIYPGANGASYMAIAHYSSSHLSTIALPLTPSSTPLQTYTYSMPGPGPNPARQDAPHPHEAKLDPSGQFLLVPDLGADLIRIHAVDAATGLLTNCANYTAEPGSGPRHVDFWVSPAMSAGGMKGKRDGKRGGRERRSGFVNTTGGTYAYLGNELANTITGFEVDYSAGCLGLTETGEVSPYPEGKAAPVGAKVAEVQVYGNTLTTSNRADNSFGANNDSLALFSINSNGKFAFEDIYPTFASYPRTMVINKAGDMVAIGNQNSAEVTIVQRDVESGKFGDLLGSVVVGTEGVDGNGGLSSVIWEE